MRPGSRFRSGFALPVIVVLAMILGGMLYAVNQVVRGYQHRATRFRDGEVAFYAARAALDLAEARLEEVLTGPPPGEGRDRDLYRFLTRSAPADLSGGEDTLEVPYLERLLPEGARTDGEVEVLVRFLDVTAPGGTLPPGYRALEEEKVGTLEVEARARVRGAIRRLRARRPMRVVYRLPPVLGRFSLLVGEATLGEESANALTYAPRLGVFVSSLSADLSWPLTVYPHPPAPPDDPRTPRERFEDAPLRPLADGGWVALLGDRPWVLNTTFGPGLRSPLEEGRLLRSFEAVFPSPAISGAYEKARRLGFARNVLELPMFRDLESPDLRDLCSVLHLAGDSRSPVPPVVLGRAFRRYLEYSKVGPSESGPFTSFHGVESGDFDSVRPQVDAVAPGTGYDQYAQVMARAVIEPYNRTYDFVVTDDQRLDAQGRVRAGASPWSPRRHLTASATSPWLQPVGGVQEDFLYPSTAELPDDRRAAAVEIGSEAGGVLYAGAPDDLLPGAAEWLPARAVWEVADGPEGSASDLFARRFLREGALHLGTSVHVRAGGLSLSGLRVEHGGTVLVDGDVYVSGPLTTTPGEVLAIVSLSGNVVLTNEEPVEAALVSLRGQVIPSPRGVDLRGQMLMARFDPLRWTGIKGACRLVYDPRLNPARTELRAGQLRMHLGRERELVLERR